MTISPEQLTLNRKSAANVVRTDLGLTGNPAEWTYDEKINYNRKLSQYIADNANAFTPGEIQVAKDINQKAYDPLDDTSLVSNLGLFGDEFLNEAKKTLDISGNLIKNLLYVTVVIAVSMYMLPYALKQLAKNPPAA